MCRSKFVLQLVTVQPQSRSSWVERCECPLCVFLSSIYQCPPPGCTHGSNQTNNQLPLPHRSVTLSSVLQGPERTRLIVKCYGRSTTMRRSPKNDDHGQNIWCTFPRRFKFVIRWTSNSSYDRQPTRGTRPHYSTSTDDFHGLCTIWTSILDISFLRSTPTEAFPLGKSPYISNAGLFSEADEVRMF